MGSVVYPANPAQPNTALVRTEQRVLVRVQGYLPPHNFTVIPTKQNRRTGKKI